MALVPQSFSIENIKLQFHSFIHPETGELWATANDIAKSLGYENPADAIYKHVKNPTFKSKWKDLTEGVCVAQRPPNWQNNTMMINEGGINRLIMACHLRNVDHYRDWVCGTVLPTIRKTGRFILNNGDDKLVQLMNGLLESNHALIRANQHLEDARRDAITLSHRIADMAEDIVSKPASRRLLHTLAIHELDSESKKIAFTRCQRRSMTKALRRLFDRNPQARELYNTAYIPNGVNVLNCVKECLKKDDIPYSAQNNVIKLLNNMSSEEIVNCVREVIARPHNRALVPTRRNRRT